jgi:large subunit ribosomal protein L29
MKFKEILSMSDDELRQKEKDLKKELMKLRAQIAIGTNPESPGRIGQIRKTLARIQTKRVRTKKK